MKKRDLKADLELCNRATPGPWEAEDGLADPMVVMGRDYSHYFYVHTERDAQFIAQAREGWPHAIERALKAERALGNETILNGKALAKLNERALKAESLARELAKEMELMRMAVNALLLGEDVPVEVVDRITLGVSSVLLKAKEVLGDE